MFNIDPSPTFRAPVPLSVPGIDQPIEVVVVFKHQNRDALKAWVDKAGSVSDVQLLGEVIESWDNLQDQHGQPVPYSVTALSKLLTNYAPSRGEFYRAYVRELTEAKKKIS